jgi:hypothetical protein
MSELLDLNEIKFEPITVKIGDVEYSAIPITASVEKKLEPLTHDVIYNPPKALTAQRAILGMLLNLPAKILDNLESRLVSVAATYVMEKIGEAKKKQKKKSD